MSTAIKVRGVTLSMLALALVPAVLGQTPLAAPMQLNTTIQTLDRAGVDNYQPLPQTRVTWDARGLEIEASNSSLNQILRQVAAYTGAKLEGLSRDQRIFGTYGPGPASDVLLNLLEGSGYNLVIVGGRNADPPLAIALSTRLPGGPQIAANNLNQNHTAKADAGEPEPQPEDSSTSSHAEVAQNPFSNGNAELPKDPEQFMQAILQRQQKIDEQQQQQQQDGQTPQQ